MGSPRRFKKHYETPKKLWVAQRIEEEKALRKQYGLKNAKELWKAETLVKKARRIATKVEKRSKVGEELLAKLKRYGLLPKTANVSDILNLTAKDVLERRLQTIVYKKGLANSLRQARQLIVHGFIAVAGRKKTAPGYLVKVEEEDKVSYYRPIQINKPEKKEEKGEEKKEKEGENRIEIKGESNA
ncbi:MAG: 30S ribosomal protein S4 [Candidatus Micrarchaeia archaeon]|jgi:small subunit ribosomal protein S4